MKKLTVLLTAAVVVGCAADPAAPPHESVAGYFVAAERPDVGLYLYDDVAGSAPEQFFVRQQGSASIGYWWGTYVEAGGSLTFTPYQPTGPALSGSAWSTRPRELAATVAGVGRLTFKRTADAPPEGLR